VFWLCAVVMEYSVVRMNGGACVGNQGEVSCEVSGRASSESIRTYVRSQHWLSVLVGDRLAPSVFPGPVKGRSSQICHV
jgi:hypothetical protein